MWTRAKAPHAACQENNAATILRPGQQLSPHQYGEKDVFVEAARDPPAQLPFAPSS